MKKLPLVLILIAVLCSAGFCMSKNKVTTITGVIKSYGNVPFTFIGIETFDGKKYTIKADEDVLNELSQLQGVKIELEGTVVNQNDEKSDFKKLKDGTFEVQSWNVN